jgi:hypothetical protein
MSGLPLAARRIHQLDGSLWKGSALDADEFDFKDKRRVRADGTTRALFAIGKFGGHEELPFRAGLHEREGFGPGFDHAVNRECDRLAALVRVVEFRAVQECAAIVNGDLIGRLRLRAVAFGEHFVLEAARQRLHAFFRFVSSEKFRAFLFVLFSELLEPLDFFLLKILLKGHERVCTFLVAKLRFCAGDAVLQPGHERLRVQVERVRFHVGADLDTDTVAGFVALVFEDGWVIRESRRNEREHGERSEIFKFHLE